MSLFGGRDEKNTGDKISVIAQLRAKSGHEDEVRSMLAKLVEPSQKEPGCIKYNILEDAHYPGSFFTHEQWESEEALDQHLQVNKAGLNKVKAYSGRTSGSAF
jgi:quinol monooxygenase YgiN